jgi:hypothetical protein
MAALSLALGVGQKVKPSFKSRKLSSGIFLLDRFITEQPV